MLQSRWRFRQSVVRVPGIGRHGPYETTFASDNVIFARTGGRTSHLGDQRQEDGHAYKPSLRWREKLMEHPTFFEGTTE
jgi:hypothetical protein